MAKYWMISDRDRGPGGIGTGTGMNDAGLTYWISDTTPLNKIDNWKKVSAANFKKLLIAAAADAFLPHAPAQSEAQSHVTLLIHGFNVSFDSHRPHDPRKHGPNEGQTVTCPRQFASATD